MTKLKIDFPERRLFVRLFGGDVYAVGGAVRDIIRGSPSPDVDILVARHTIPDIVRRLKMHGRVGLVGRSFGIIKFTMAGRTYDVALPRKDVPRGGGAKSHKDFLIAADPGLPIEKDLGRRDFRAQQHGPPAQGRPARRPLRRPGRHAPEKDPADGSRRLSRRSLARPPRRPVRLGPRLLRRPRDLRHRPGRRPPRPERRTRQ